MELQFIKQKSYLSMISQISCDSKQQIDETRVEFDKISFKAPLTFD